MEILNNCEKSKSPMTRCDYDTIFQRVFCVTLVAIAFTFTVILTNVFVDIDGLLSRKDKVKTFTNLEPSFENEKQVKPSPNDLEPPPYYKHERSFEDSEDNYRSKRSLESQNFLFHIRNPKMKGILTSRLATLLEELDEEESSGNDKRKDKGLNRNKEVEIFAKEPFPDGNQNPHRESKSNHESSNTDEDLLHLAMHNILLQGIIGHMDLNEVYKKVHMLVNNFKKTSDRVDVSENRKRHQVRKQSAPIKIINEIKEDIANKENIENLEGKIRIPKINIGNQLKDNNAAMNNKPTQEESKFFQEMAECEKLESDVKKIAEMKQINDKEKSTGTPHLPNVLIKTIIDITSLNKNKTHKQEGNTDSKERVKGIIQLIYNGKSVKFTKMDDDGTATRRFNDHITTSNHDIHHKKQVEEQPFENAEFNDAIEILQEKRQDKSDAFINEFLSEYLIKDPQKFSSFIESVDSRHNYKAKRYKRQIKIRYQDVDADNKKAKPKKFSLAKTNDDELYVEIETHFGSKGMKGEKKKKLIRNLIDKIQKAIHSDADLMKDIKKKKRKPSHIKKRIQHPLEKNRTLFINKVMIPIDSIGERHSDPISKTVPVSEQNHLAHTIADKSGEKWRKAYYGPGFLTVAKSVNSAEMGEVNIDYNKMQSPNDIPPRQQIPLNSDVSVETINTNSFFDMGDLKFFIKDIDGTGLSIGFNQYTDEAPDPETMKVFTGIENLIKNYHQNEDRTEKPQQLENHYLPASEEKAKHDISKRETSGNSNQHVVIRRSIKEVNNKDYHSNEYRIIYNGNFLPYDNYKEVIEEKNKKIAFKLNKDENFYPFKGKSDERDFRESIKLNELPALMGDNIFYKKLKPSEILNLASMINRKKRNAPTKEAPKRIKINKFINRRSSRFSPKKLILSKKRSKRQVDKIRIIATDNLSNAAKGRESGENIFLVSNENIFADRAMVRNVEGINDAMNEMSMRDKIIEDHFPPIMPYAYDEPSTVQPFSFRMNPLMSRYPHIIMEEAETSEQLDPLFVNNMQVESIKAAKQNDIFGQLLEQTTESITPANIPEANFDQRLLNVEPHIPNQNYKLTVRVMPRNASNLNSGFKEIHTSINKSFNRNGKIYTSLFNVSEISKIENINSTDDPILIPLPTTTTGKPEKPCLKKRIKEQQEKMNFLLKQHRKRIDEQLEHLKAERNNIEALAVKSLLVNAKEASIDNEPKTSLTDYDINQLVALMKTESSTTTTTTTEPTTTTTPAVDLEKIKIVNTIKRNENLTNEILHQIKRNTELLQTFLMKLSGTLKEPEEKTKEEIEEVKPTLPRSDKIWKPYISDQFNETHSPIPFVYAFQHPYGGKRKSEKVPIASVVYHGLIHTLKTNKNSPRNNEEIINQTKYFIDDVENSFKDVANMKDLAKATVLNVQNATSVKI